jgi:hypothetical protein
VQTMVWFPIICHRILAPHNIARMNEVPRDRSTRLLLKYDTDVMTTRQPEANRLVARTVTIWKSERVLVRVVHLLNCRLGEDRIDLTKVGVKRTLFA